MIVRLFSTCTNRAAGLGIPHGTDNPTGIPPEPGARDDAAADASHQAAAALEPRPAGLCRGGTRKEPAARARRRRRRSGSSGRSRRRRAARRRTARALTEWMGEDLATSRNAIEERTRHPARQRVPGGWRLRGRLGAHRGCDRPAFGMGERRIRRPRRRRLQSRSLRLGRADARRPSGRATLARR